MTAVGYPAARLFDAAPEVPADTALTVDQLLLIATMSIWRTLGELDQLVECDAMHKLRPADYQAWHAVRDGIAAEMTHLCDVLDILDPEHTLRRPITDGPSAPVGSPPAAPLPAAQPEATSPGAAQ